MLVQQNEFEYEFDFLQTEFEFDGKTSLTSILSSVCCKLTSVINLMMCLRFFKYIFFEVLFTDSDVSVIADCVTIFQVI